MFLFDTRWSGRYSWGISHNQTGIHFLSSPPGVHSVGNGNKNLIITSSSEDKTIHDKLEGQGFKVIHAAGAGYKIMCAVDDLVGSYVLSQGTTFKWDSCGPHAILLSLGGGIVDFNKALDCMREHGDSSESELGPCLQACQVQYHQPDEGEHKPGETWSNSGGIIAYRDLPVLVNVLRSLV